MTILELLDEEAGEFDACALDDELELEDVLELPELPQPIKPIVAETANEPPTVLTSLRLFQGCLGMLFIVFTFMFAREVITI